MEVSVETLNVCSKSGETRRGVDGMETTLHLSETFRGS
ncbi:hypothetical protein CCACVL1_04537, partial [Corchorus capsularis]